MRCFVLACFFLFAFPSLGLAKTLNEEDILLARLDLAALNKKSPSLKEFLRRFPLDLGRDARNGQTISRRYVCHDLCPDSGRFYLVYRDVKPAVICKERGECADQTFQSRCDAVGGDVLAMGEAGAGNPLGCSPRLSTMSIRLKTGELVEDVLFHHVSRFFLHLENKHTMLWLPWEHIDSLILNDGTELKRLKNRIKPPDAPSDPRAKAEVLFEEAGDFSRTYGKTTESLRVQCNLLTQAVRLNPSLIKAYERLVVLYSECGGRCLEEKQAFPLKPAIEGLLNVKPEAEVFHLLSKVTDDYDERAGLLEKAYELSGHSSEITKDLAYCYVAQLGPMYLAYPRDVLKAARYFARGRDLYRTLGRSGLEGARRAETSFEQSEHRRLDEFISRMEQYDKQGRALRQKMEHL